MKENLYFDQMFDELLNNSNGNDYFYDDEGFITSKEISKHKELAADHPELIPLPSGPDDIDEEVHFKRYTKKGRIHKYTDKEMEEIRSGCETVIVNDYSECDEYHLSDEEKARLDALAEIRLKLGTLKKTYRKIDQYIEAMRIVIKAWQMIETKENYLHSKEEFFQMVHDGRIFHPGIIMPRMKGLDKYNIDLVVKYISNSELDPSDLAPIKQSAYDAFYDEEWDDESEEEEMERLLSPEEIQFILDTDRDNAPMIELHEVKRSLLKGYDTSKILFGKEKKKKSKKKDQYSRDNLQTILKKIQNNPAFRETDYYTASYMITQSMFSPEEKEKDFWDDLYYTGSWTDKGQLFAYNIAVNEELASQRCPGDRYINQGDRELQEFFRTMEENGMNVIELRRRMSLVSDSTSNKVKKKENKKIEQELLQRVIKLNKSNKFKALVNKAEKKIQEEIQS